jgi:hypothetical protein
MKQMNTDNNIEDDDLNGKIPHLDKMGGKNPFGANNDYFEHFSDKIMGSVSDFEEIRLEAPFLSGIPKYNPFEVPVGYFDGLPTMVQERCPGKNKQQNSLMDWLILLIKPNFALPVITVIVIAFLGIHYSNLNSVKPTNPIAEEVSVDDQLRNIDENTIVDALTADSETETVTDKDNEHIKDYLIENDVEEQNLNSEL